MTYKEMEDVSVKLYFENARQYPALTPEDELRLGTVLDNSRKEIICTMLLYTFGRDLYLRTILPVVNGLSSPGNIVNAEDGHVKDESIKKELSDFVCELEKGSSPDNIMKTLRCAILKSSVIQGIKKEFYHLISRYAKGEDKSQEIDRQKASGLFYKMMELENKYCSASKEMLCRSQNIVIKLAKRYAWRAPLMDLIQEGNIGLMRALETFDVSLGKFYCYATDWVKVMMVRFIEKDSVVNPSFAMIDSINTMSEIKRIESLRGTPVNDEELVSKMGVDITRCNKIEELMNSRGIISLNSVNDAGQPIADSITDESESPQDLAERAELVNIVRSEIDKLDPRTAHIIAERMDEKCGKDIATTLKISPQRVNFIEKQAKELLAYQIGKHFKNVA